MKTLIFLLLFLITSCTLQSPKCTDLNELKKYGTPLTCYRGHGSVYNYTVVFKDSLNIIREIGVSRGVYDYFYINRNNLTW